MFYHSAFIMTEPNDAGFESKEDYVLVNSTGHFEFNRKWSSRHRDCGRADYLMMYVHSGAMRVRAGGIDKVAGTGSVVLYRPGQEQLYRDHDESPVKVYWVHFTGYGVEQLLESLDLGEEALFDIGVNTEIPSLVQIMVNDLHIKSMGYKTMAASLFMQILTVIARKSLRLRNKTCKKSADDFIGSTLEYIHVNYMKDITVAQLSEMTMLCTNRYIKVFKKEVGMTPKEYIIRLRLEKACELLESTDLDIKQISGMVGLENQLYFSRLFKKHLGEAPSRYRGSTAETHA